MAAPFGTAKRPLEYFIGKTREEILKEPGVGRKTYRRIKRALFWRSVTAPFRYLGAAWGGIRDEWAKGRLQKTRRKGRRDWLSWALLVLAGLLALAALVGFTAPLIRSFAQSLSAAGEEAAPGAFVAEATPTPEAMAMAEEAEEPTGAEAAVAEVHLRVETQLLDTTYGIWRRLPGVPVLLSPYQEGDVAPDEEREGTLRQVTEERLTTDGFKVAETTFTAPIGLYWVWVDEEELPSDCMVWLPLFEEDEGNQINVSPWKIVNLVSHGAFNTTVVKFQIVCGIVRVTPTPSSPPGKTPTTPPTTETPPPEETPTPPPPTETPVPSPTPTEIVCGVDCVTPSTPVPTPTPYPPDVSTPTPVFGDG
ncbi:hypothetical protein GTO10_01410 [Candidatus Saccharibacteria bacterium]|nr:hypothetical protein [Candidatus Saccharibacteria bacterium]